MVSKVLCADLEKPKAICGISSGNIISSKVFPILGSTISLGSKIIFSFSSPNCACAIVKHSIIISQSTVRPRRRSTCLWAILLKTALMTGFTLITATEFEELDFKEVKLFVWHKQFWQTVVGFIQKGRQGCIFKFRICHLHFAYLCWSMKNTLTLGS